MEQRTTDAWWDRERQRFLKRVFIGLLLVLILIGYFAYINSQGHIGYVDGVNFPTANYIAFVRREKDGNAVVYAIRADGSDLRRLTAGSDPPDKEHPSWTPNGKSLVLSARNVKTNTVQLYILGSGAPVQLTYGSGNKFSPTVSSDGKHVAFITQGVIKTVTLTGTDVMQVLPLPRSGNESEGGTMTETEFAPYLSAAFASDGVTISGIQDVSNVIIQARSEDSDPGRKPKAMPIDQQVVVLPASASRPQPAVAQGHEVSMSWEPDGARLACSYTEFPMLDEKGRAIDTERKPLPPGSSPIPISAIHIWSFAGSRPTQEQLYACVGYSVEPRNIVWAPNRPGEPGKLAFELWRLKGEGVRELLGIRVLELKEIGKDANGAPTYQGYKNLPEDVADLPLLVRAGTEGKPQNPRWSPDSRRLCYEMVRSDGYRDLWTINADGTNPINLTKGQGDNSQAAWAPAQ